MPNPTISLVVDGKTVQLPRLEAFKVLEAHVRDGAVLVETASDPESFETASEPVIEPVKPVKPKAQQKPAIKITRKTKTKG